MRQFKLLQKYKDVKIHSITNIEEIPDENTLIKIRALFLTKDEEENRDKKFWGKFGGR